MKKFSSGFVLAAAAGSLLIASAAPAAAAPINYGAIALSPSGHLGYAVDAATSSAAAAAAMDQCGRGDCKVVARFSNGCGAVAFSKRSNKYTFGVGSSKAAARGQALNRNAADASIVHWSCTTGYQL